MHPPKFELENLVAQDDFVNAMGLTQFPTKAVIFFTNITMYGDLA